jgi:ketosteroid isomerase-like protein
MERRNAALVRELYEARARGDLDAVRSVLAGDVLWHEPEVNNAHTGDLRGVDAVLGMIREAQELTDGTFELRLRDVVAHGEQVVAFVDWSSTRGGKTLEGKEIAVYRVRGGELAEVWFHPDNLKHDEEFWAP